MLRKIKVHWKIGAMGRKILPISSKFHKLTLKITSSLHFKCFKQDRITNKWPNFDFNRGFTG